MSSSLDEIEQWAILESLHQSREQLGLGSAKEMAARLIPKGSSITIEKAINFVYRKPVSSEIRQTLAQEGLALLAEREDVSLAALGGMSPHTSRYVEAILQALSASKSEAALERAAHVRDWIWTNWTKKTDDATPQYWSGAFQMVRRYKHSTSKSAEEELSEENYEIVLFELIFVNAEKRETTMITSKGNIYYGSFVINHDQIITNVYHRRPSSGNISQRILSMKLEDIDLPAYSAIMLKMGDTSKRPISSDAILIPIPPPEHPAALDAMLQISDRKSMVTGRDFITEDSILWDYLSDSPPNRPRKERSAAWDRVEYIKDHQELFDLSRPDEFGRIFFSEPTRTISHDDLVSIAKSNPPKVFRRSRSRPAA